MYFNILRINLIFFSQNRCIRHDVVNILDCYIGHHHSGQLLEVYVSLWGPFPPTGLLQYPPDRTW